LQKLEGFYPAKPLDVHMEYSHIKLNSYLSIIWGESFFSKKMCGLMVGLEFTIAYIDDLLAVFKESLKTIFNTWKICSSDWQQKDLESMQPKVIF
jgi:hypothetical protein